MNNNNKNSGARLDRRRLLALPLAAAAAAPARAATGAVVLAVSGSALGNPARNGRTEFDMAALAALPQHTIVTATPWFQGTSEFSGPLLRDVLRAAGAPPEPAASALRCTALNDYRVEIPLTDPKQWDVIVAHRHNRKPMSVREKGPLFVIYPFDRHPQLRTTAYYSRCIWQLKSIELV